MEFFFLALDIGSRMIFFNSIFKEVKQHFRKVTFKKHMLLQTLQKLSFKTFGKFKLKNACYERFSNNLNFSKGEKKDQLFKNFQQLLIKL